MSENIPCLLCGKQLDRRIDRNRKPYFICDPCGMQIFIRRRHGIDRLNELIRVLRGRDLPFREHAKMLYEIQATLTEINGLKSEMKKLDGVFNFFSNDRDKKRALTSLRNRIDHLLSHLQDIAKGRV
jgi:hypothetical protein